MISLVTHLQLLAFQHLNEALVSCCDRLKTIKAKAFQDGSRENSELEISAGFASGGNSLAKLDLNKCEDNRILYLYLIKWKLTRCEAGITAVPYG